MNDTYVECLVKGKESRAAKVGGVVLIFFTVLFVAATIIVPLALILAVLTGVAAYFVRLNSSVEYEYLYVDKEISVDKIMSKSGRRHVADYSLDRMEIFAPIKSWRLNDYGYRNVKTVDYSTGKEEEPDKRYVMYYEGGVKVIFSPSEAFVKALYNAAPRKVFKE